MALVSLAFVALAAGGAASARDRLAIFHPTTTKRCLAEHRVAVLPLLAWRFRPRPTARFGFGTTAKDNGYIAFYSSASLAREAAARWVAEQRAALGMPNIQVPGIRETIGNVFIDWLAGPKTPESRKIVTSCLH